MSGKTTVVFMANVEECPYWDFEKHIPSHTCGSCECAYEGNNINNAKNGVMIGKDRYCTLDIDIYAKMAEAVSKIDPSSLVKRGRWEAQTFIFFDSEKTYFRCSECKTTWDNKMIFCPNCGAKMNESGALMED